MSKVFIVQEDSKKNFDAARKFGDLYFLLTEGQLGSHEVKAVTERIFDILQDNKYNEREDYLLLVGDPVAIAIAAMAANMLSLSVVQVLKWDRLERLYIPITLEVE